MKTRRFRQAVLAAVVVTLLGGMTGCAMEPWVKPYEREFLADPIMSNPRNPISEKHRQHVFDTREAARGAVTSEGGGCGCN
jgi:hypothetical protein